MKVKVKIALVIDENGVWNANGWSSDKPHHDEEVMDMAIEGVGDGEARYWIEAEVDTPEVKTIAGTVTPAKEDE